MTIRIPLAPLTIDSGPPGVGKTSTVEAAAEWFNLPLYSISAGELDVGHGDPNSLDKQLKRIFKIAKHFDAVLLLDEADAYMELTCSCGRRKEPSHFYSCREGRKAAAHPWGQQPIVDILTKKAGFTAYADWLGRSHFYTEICKRH